MRKSQLEKLREAKRAKFSTVETDLEGFLKLMLDPSRPLEERRINPTQKEFILSPERYTAFMGPAGSAKTSAGVVKVMARALLTPGSEHGIGRLDYNKLMDTTMARAQEVLNALPPGTLLDRDKTPPMKWWLKTVPRKLPNGDIDERPSKLIFMGLKESLGSYEFNSFAVDEADEVDEKRILEIDTRLRHPGGSYNISLMFNPPPEDHYLYTLCTGMDARHQKVREPLFKLFVPLPKENQRNLPDGYYEKLSESLPEDMRQRLVDGRWGTTFPGQPVVRQFKRSVHVVDSLKYAPGATLYRWWDFGYSHPACLFAIIDWQGRIRILREILGANIEARAFARQVLNDTEKHFPTATKFVDYGDIAVKQKKDTGQTLAELMKEGIQIRCSHMSIELSLNFLRRRFETLIEGEPAILLDRSCLITINGLQGGYHLKDDGVTPHKDGYYDHLMDALRYGVWNSLGGGAGSSAITLPSSIAYSPEADRVR